MTETNKTAKSETKKSTQSSKAGLLFLVARVHSMLKKGRYADRIGPGAAEQTFRKKLNKLLDGVTIPQGGELPNISLMATIPVVPSSNMVF